VQRGYVRKIARQHGITSYRAETILAGRKFFHSDPSGRKILILDDYNSFKDGTKKRKYTVKEIAKKYSVSQSHLRKILYEMDNWASDRGDESSRVNWRRKPKVIILKESEKEIQLPAPAQCLYSGTTQGSPLIYNNFLPSSPSIAGLEQLATQESIKEEREPEQEDILSIASQLEPAHLDPVSLESKQERKKPLSPTERSFRNFAYKGAIAALLALNVVFFANKMFDLNNGPKKQEFLPTHIDSHGFYHMSREEANVWAARNRKLVADSEKLNDLQELISDPNNEKELIKPAFQPDEPVN
jgi:hypothetical protein